MELKNIDANIVKIGKAGLALNELIQVTAVAIVAHCMGAGQGDCTRALRLVQAMPKSTRRNLLINWFQTFSPIGMNVSTGKVGLHKEGSKLYNAFDLDGATATPWYNQPQAADEELVDTTIEDARKTVLRTVKSLQKKLDDGLVANDDRPAVTALVATLTAAAA